MKRTHNVSTEIEYLNIDEILANYHHRKFWKKKWLIFKVKDFDAIWQMKSINVEENKIESIVKIEYKGKYNIKEHWWSNNDPMCYCQSIPIEHQEYSQTVFMKNILGSLITCIDYLEQRIIKNSYEYKGAERLESDERDKLKEIANDFLDSEGVKNDEIRDAYIEHYISNAKKFDYTGELYKTAPRKYYPTARLLACSWFNNKKRFDEEAEIVKGLKGTKKKFIYDIWKAKKELEGGEYLEEAEDMLESL